MDARKKLTGAVVEGFTLSGWRRDKHGWYRMWLGLVPFVATVVSTSHHRVDAIMPRRAGASAQTQTTIRMLPKRSVAKKKFCADYWLTEKITAYQARAEGPPT